MPFLFSVRVLPYMSPAECGAVLADHVARSLTSPLHMRLRTTLQGIHTRGRRQAKNARAPVFVDGHVDYAAAFGRFADWLFKCGEQRGVPRLSCVPPSA
jgi:hypothetical protein